MVGRGQCNNKTSINTTFKKLINYLLISPKGYKTKSMTKNVRVRPTEGTAFQWNGNIFAAKEELKGAKLINCNSRNQLKIVMGEAESEQTVIVEAGHYLIDTDGKLTTCNAQQFEATYEIVEQAETGKKSK